jgi:hypothetical protein
MLIQQPGDFHGRSLRRLPGSSSELTMSPSPVATVARSHLSPDGGSLPRHAYHRLAADGYDSARSHLSPVATCRQTVEAFLATPTTAWQPMATNQGDCYQSVVADCQCRSELSFAIAHIGIILPASNRFSLPFDPKKTGNPVVARFVLDQFLQDER